MGVGYRVVMGQKIVLVVLVFIGVTGCQPFKSYQEFNRLAERKEFYLVDKNSFDRADIDSVSVLSKGMRDFVLKFPSTRETAKVEKMLADVYAKADSLGTRLFQELKNQEKEIIYDMLPLIDSIEKISQHIVSESKKQKPFFRVMVDKNECRAIYLGRELDKFKMNLKIGKVIEVGKSEIKMNILLDTHNFNLDSYPRLKKRIGTDEQIYRYQLDKSQSIKCEVAEQLKSEFLKFDERIEDLKGTSKDYIFLSLLLKLIENKKAQ